MFIKLDRSMADVSRKQRVGTFQTSDKRPGDPEKYRAGGLGERPTARKMLKLVWT